MPAAKRKPTPVGNSRKASPVIVSTTSEPIQSEIEAGQAVAERILANGGSEALAAKMALDKVHELRDARVAERGAEALKRAEAEAARKESQRFTVRGITVVGAEAEALSTAAKTDADTASAKGSIVGALGALKANLAILGVEVREPNPDFDAASEPSESNPPMRLSPVGVALATIGGAASEAIARRMTTIDLGL